MGMGMGMSGYMYGKDVWVWERISIRLTRMDIKQVNGYRMGIGMGMGMGICMCMDMGMGMVMGIGMSMG
jgi:hypothetical protein